MSRPQEAAAAGLRARFDAMLLAGGRSAWQPAAVIAWNTWMRRLWDGLLTTGVEQRTLLNDAQEHLLWREVIAASPEAGPLLSRESLAALAARAWRLACSYEAEGELRRAAASHDARVFAGWAEAFAKECRQRQCVSAAAVEAAVRRHMESSAADVPARLCLVGFDDDTPSRARLLAVMAARGTVIEQAELRAEPGEQLVVAADSLRAEAAAAARWVRAFLEREGMQRRVAVVVPGLGEERAELEPVLREVLAPELQQVGADLAAAPYAFSVGRTLAESPVAATALDALRWCVEELPLESVSGLLLSAYLGTEATLAARAAFDAHTLRHVMLPRPELSAARVERLAEGFDAVRVVCAPIARHAAAFAGSSVAFSEWMERFAKALADAGFPGDRPASTQETVDLRAWQRACDAVASLDFAAQRVNAKTALEALAHQCRETASRGPELAPVQVITPPEAAGGWYDALVFLRTTDAQWPASEKTNPLLGWGLQQAHKMPGTDPALAAERGQRATERLVGSAPAVLFFYATNTDEEAGPQRLAPVVERLGWRQVRAEELPGANAEQRPVPLERMADETPLPPVPPNGVRGGAQVLKLQAACGFRAFAELRLQASPIEDAVAGFDYRESGNMLHETMERFWAQVETQDELKRLGDAERMTKLRTAVDRALARVVPEGAWDAAYIDVQKQRLRALVMQWLTKEMERAPFRVLQREEDRAVTVGPLTLRLRFDRIDEVEGGTLLVDYKTGQQLSHRDWAGERPEEPQLPLYSLLPEAERLKGVAFARIRAGKDMGWAYLAEDGIFPKARLEYATMQEQVEAWRWVLERLAQQFADGDTSVDPKVFDLTCRHCEHRILCRVDGLALLETEDGAEAGDGE